VVRARIAWAEMVEGRGIRHWEEGVYLFRSEDREAAFQRALESAKAGKAAGRKKPAVHALGRDPVGRGDDTGVCG